MRNIPIIVGMSGGVDSSVAAWLLKEQGYKVFGLFMKNWEEDDNSEYCSTRQDWIDVVSVADLIGIDVEIVNFSSEYKDSVFLEFLREYLDGRTPNPDVLCNPKIKFKTFLDYAISLGAEKIATGHYARIRERNSYFELLRAFDYAKDQSYFLYRLNQIQLSRSMFPLGEINKTKVREIALKIGLPNAKKKDSTGICFVGERPFRNFLRRYLPTKPGPMKMINEEIIGKHIGLAFYTIGQRRGIGIGGVRNSIGKPWFVAEKDISSNTLYIVQGHDHPWLFSRRLVANNVSWIAGEPPRDKFHVFAKTRYQHIGAECIFSRDRKVNLEETSKNTERFSLAFNTIQWAVTPGQSVVLYEGDLCLGGGIIESTDTKYVRYII